MLNGGNGESLRFSLKAAYSAGGGTSRLGRSRAGSGRLVGASSVSEASVVAMGSTAAGSSIRERGEGVPWSHSGRSSAASAPPSNRPSGMGSKLPPMLAEWLPEVREARRWGRGAIPGMGDGPGPARDVGSTISRITTSRPKLQSSNTPRLGAT